jgi:hypothetical protein
MSVILDIQEAEVGGLWIEDSTGNTLASWLKSKQIVILMPVALAAWEAAIRGLLSKASLGKKVRSFLKNKLKA